MKISSLSCYSLQLTVYNSYQKFALVHPHPVLFNTETMQNLGFLTDLIFLLLQHM